MRVPVGWSEVAFCTVSVGRSVSVCAFAAGESSLGAVRVADTGVGVVGVVGVASCRRTRRRAAATTTAQSGRDKNPLLHLLILRIGAAARRVSSTMTLRCSRMTLSDRRAVFRMPPMASKISRSARRQRLVLERVLDQQLEAGDRHRLVERDQRAAVGQVQQLDAGALLERAARIHDDHRMAAERRELRRADAADRPASAAPAGRWPGSSRDRARPARAST